MRTELFIGWRYLATKRKEKFLSLISIISVLGVAIGVAALIVVISVMSGFDRDLRDKIIGNYAHITITGSSGINAKEYEEIAKKLKPDKDVRALSPYVQGQVLVKEGERFVALGLKGIEPALESETTKIGDYLIYGELTDLGQDSVIIGKELALYLGLGLNSSLLVYSPVGKQFSLKVAGIFNSGMYDYDMNLVFTNLKTAQELFGLKDTFSAIAVKIDNLFLADKLLPKFSAALDYNYYLKSWTQVNQNFFAALKLEKLVMFIILTLVILVASLNIISTLMVMVVEKTKDIGILRAIGMSSGQIRKIFTFEGLLIGTLGTLCGTAAGISLCLLLKEYQFVKLPQDIYYIDRLPVVIDWMDISLVILAAMLITVISTIYPAAKAAGLKPVEALRYE